MSAAKLYYFDGRGLGAIVRLSLAACGIPFTEELLKEKDQIEKWRKDGKLLFSQVPILEIDGLQLVQSGAIARYLARKTGLYGKTDEETAKYIVRSMIPVAKGLLQQCDLSLSRSIDMLFEGSRDFMMFFIEIWFEGEQQVLKVAREKSLPRYLPVFDQEMFLEITYDPLALREFMKRAPDLIDQCSSACKVLKENDTGYLVGGSLTIADIGLLEPMLTSVEYFGNDIMKEYPSLQKFYKMMTSLPNISQFLSGPQRKKANNEAYTSLVTRVLYS